MSLKERIRASKKGGGTEKEEKKKKEEEEKISHMCESISHRPLRGCCPKTVSKGQFIEEGRLFHRYRFSTF